ncbi:MAG: hypothetical protein ACI8XO_004464 [Verrucomicrobiales bacterium]|jgi:hypothetical protein
MKRWRDINWRTDRWFRPIHYRNWEMLIMRLLLGLVVLHAYPSRLKPADVGDEVGLARFVSLDWMAEPGVLAVCWWGLFGSLVFYVAGRLNYLVLPVIAFLTIAPATLENSQGAALHHLQVLGLVVLLQWLWFTWRSIVAKEWVTAGRRTQLMNVFYTQQVIVAAYLTTAVWKLWKTNFGWIRESKYFPVQLAKSRDAEYYNKLEHGVVDSGGLFGGIDAWFAKMTPHLEAFLFANPNLCRLVIGSGLLLELFAFLALVLGRRSRFLYGGLLVMFHLIIGRVMSLNFEYNIFLLLIFFVNVPWLGLLAVRRLKLKLRSEGSA